MPQLPSGRIEISPGCLGIVGIEHDREWLIAELPEDTPLADINRIIRDNRGIGIDIEIRHPEKEELHSDTYW